MAARSVRCFLHNQTDNSLFYHSDDHVHGQFTDPWSPPAEIKPGEVGEWRTESDGFMTGTEGTVRYQTAVNAADGTHTEHIGCHWDNPFIGTNNGDMYAFEDFTNKPSKTLKVAYYIQANGAPPPNAVKMAGGDVEAWIDAVLFPPYVLANWNTASFNDANAYYAVKAGALPSYHGGFPGPPTGKKSSKLNTKSVPAEWAGRWTSAEVTVSLVCRGGKSMTAYVTDRSAKPMLQFEQNFELGALSWAGDHLVSEAIVRQSSGSKIFSDVLRASTATTIGALTRHPDEPSISVFGKAARAAAEAAGVPASSRPLEKASKAIGLYLAQTRGTVTLPNGVFLTLYDTFVGGQKTGGFLQYTRQLFEGYTAYTARLEYQLDLH